MNKYKPYFVVNKQFKEVLIFGAGASFGSCDSRVPPLTKNLISELVKFDPTGWGHIPKKYRALFYEDFEKGFSEFTTKYPETLGPLQRALSCYFFTFTSNPSNLFIELAKRIKEANWYNPIVTLNYDRFLESSLHLSNIKPILPGMNSDIIEGDFILPVCYPHGCCNLFYKQEKMQLDVNPKHHLILKNREFFPYAKISGSNVYFSTNLLEFQEKIEGSSFPPIMSYVIPSKTTNVGEEFIKLQQQKLNRILKDASKIGIVGVSIRPHDKHIWEPLAKTNATIFYCSGINSKKEYETWASVNRTNWKKDVIFDSNWADCFDEFCSNFNLNRNDTINHEPLRSHFSDESKIKTMKKFVKNFRREGY